MSCCLPPFRISAKILCRNNRKRPYDKEQAILLLSANKNCQLTDDRILLTEKTFILIFRVITIADSLLTSRMTPCRLLSSERSRECFEGNQETEQWNGVKNLLLEWHLTAFLTTATDPLITPWMTPCRLLSFWTEARIPCGKDGRRGGDTQWWIYSSDDV